MSQTTVYNTKTQHYVQQQMHQQGILYGVQGQDHQLYEEGRVSC